MTLIDHKVSSLNRPSKKKRYEKKLFKMNEDKEKIKLELSENGKLFLQPGNYTLKISGDGKTTSSTFKLK